MITNRCVCSLALRICLLQDGRKTGRVTPFKKIITAASRKDDGLQLADGVAEAIRAEVGENSPVYYWTFAGKIADLWETK